MKLFKFLYFVKGWILLVAQEVLFDAIKFSKNKRGLLRVSPALS